MRKLRHLSTGTGALPLPRPNHPVTWPIYKGNHAIKSGMQPETGATLKVYNWTAYINQAVVNSFAKKYNCKVQVSTFNTMDEALAKIHSGQVDFDVFMGVTIDVLGPLVEQKFIQPLNHSYIPNITDAWPDFQNPFYDGSGSTPCPTRSTRPGSHGGRTRTGEPVHDGQAVETCSGSRSTRARSRSSTTTARASASA